MRMLSAAQGQRSTRVNISKVFGASIVFVTLHTVPEIMHVIIRALKLVCFRKISQHAALVSTRRYYIKVDGIK